MLANNLYNIAPKDGTSIAIVRASVLYEQIFGNSAVKFDGRRVRLARQHEQHPGLLRFLARRRRQRACGFLCARAHRRRRRRRRNGLLLPARLQRIAGNEIQDRHRVTKAPRTASWRWSAAKSKAPAASRPARSNRLCASNTRKANSRSSCRPASLRIPIFPKCRTCSTRPRRRSSARRCEFIYAQLQISRAVAAPPGLPAERLATLRAAFDAAVVDPGFLDEAKKQNLDIHPINGVETAKIVERFFSSPNRRRAGPAILAQDPKRTFQWLRSISHERRSTSRRNHDAACHQHRRSIGRSSRRAQAGVRHRLPRADQRRRLGGCVQCQRPAAGRSHADNAGDEPDAGDGRQSSTSRRSRPVRSNWKAHPAIYLERPDVNAIVHVHPPYAVAFGTLGEEFPPHPSLRHAVPRQHRRRRSSRPDRVGRARRRARPQRSAATGCCCSAPMAPSRSARI